MAFTWAMAYTTNLTEPQFEILEQLLPQSKTRGYTISRHMVVNAILYQLKNGCQWRDLPADFPKWQTVYSQLRRWQLRRWQLRRWQLRRWQLRRWQLDGTWERVLHELTRREREAVKKTTFQAS